MGNSGLKKCPVQLSRMAQVDFLAGQVTITPYLPMGKGPGKTFSNKIIN